jgi:hypothetical protein
MAISRPFLLAVLGAVLLGATVLAVQNARDTTSSDAAPAAIQNEAAPTTPAPSDTGPQETLKQAFDLSDVESARFGAKLTFNVRGVGARVGVQGRFDTAGDSAVPKFAVNARISAAHKTVGGGFVSLGDKAYFVRGDTGWRVPDEIWSPFVQKVSTDTGAAQKKSAITLHPDAWVRDLKSEGTESVGGVQVEHVSGRVDAQAFMNDVRSAAGGDASDLPSGAEVQRVVKRADFDVWVGKDDHVLRRFSADLTLAGRGRIDVDVRLSGINKSQTIEAPAHVLKGAPGGSLGTVSNIVVAGVNGFSGTQTPSLAALTSPNPGRAARAVRHHKKVVILFRNDRGLDDRQMVSVVRSVDGRTKALVLSDPVDAVDRYGKLLQDLGVNETPSVVIIDSRGKARLIEGYVDSDTLTQAVADAR